MANAFQRFLRCLWFDPFAPRTEATSRREVDLELIDRKLANLEDHQKNILLRLRLLERQSAMQHLRDIRHG